MSFENLGSVGTNANFSEGDGGGSGGGNNLYGNMFGGNSNNEKLNELIDNIMNSNQVKALTFGLSTIFTASQNILPDINSIIQPFSISSAFSGLSLPTPAQVLGIKKGAGASK
jgi:hypothetical protein